MDTETPPDPPPEPDPAREVRPVDLRDWVDFSMKEARRTRVFVTDTLAQDLWCVEPQQSTAVLRSPDADVTYTVLGGRCWFVTDQGEVGLDPLASVLVPAGVAHGMDNRGIDPLIVLAVSAPPSDESTEGPPITRLAEAIRPKDTTGPLAKRLRAFLGQ